MPRMNEPIQLYAPPENRNTWGARLKDSLFFLGSFLSHPLSVGSIVPSSQRLARVMTAGLSTLNESDWVIEIGPGTGSFTDLALARIPDPSKYIGIELNPQFVQRLQSKYAGRCFVNDSAENVLEHLPPGVKAASAVCGLPWTLMNGAQQEKILSQLSASLRPDGEMTFFLYSHMVYMPVGRKLLRRLDSHFSGHRSKVIVGGNLPPATVFTCRK